MDLATSIYELASQSKGVDIVIHSTPAVEGLDNFALENSFDRHGLVFYGGEEYEIVATISAYQDKAGQGLQQGKQALVCMS